MRNIEKIIFHHTATKPNQDVHVPDIRRWHRERGFSDIGYHFVVCRDGSIELGRPIELAGAHCYRHNADSIGVAYVGGLNAAGKVEFNPTSAQLVTLNWLLPSLCKLYQAKLYGHRDLAATKCPGIDIHEIYPEL